MLKSLGPASLWRGGPKETRQLWTRCRVSLSTSLFFSFPLRKNSCKTPYYSLLFQFISPPACCLISSSLPFCLSLIPLNPNLPLDSALTSVSVPFFSILVYWTHPSSESLIPGGQISCFLLSVNTKGLHCHILSFPIWTNRVCATKPPKAITVERTLNMWQPVVSVFLLKIFHSQIQTHFKKLNITYIRYTVFPFMSC